MAVTGTPVSPGGGTFLSVDELRDFIGQEISASVLSPGIFDEAAAGVVIDEIEADLNGILGALGITVAVEGTDPISHRICRRLVKYGSAAQVVPSLNPARSNEDLITVQDLRNEWLRMRKEIKENPGMLTDATFGTPATFGLDASDDIRAWTATTAASADPEITRKFTTQDAQF